MYSFRSTSLDYIQEIQYLSQRRVYFLLGLWTLSFRLVVFSVLQVVYKFDKVTSLLWFVIWVTCGILPVTIFVEVAHSPCIYWLTICVIAFKQIVSADTKRFRLSCLIFYKISDKMKNQSAHLKE